MLFHNYSQHVEEAVAEAVKIVFMSYRDGNSEIFIMNADGSNVQRITNTAGIHEFSVQWLTSQAQQAQEQPFPEIIG